jgi:hypothetical protein
MLTGLMVKLRSADHLMGQKETQAKTERCTAGTTTRPRRRRCVGEEGTPVDTQSLAGERHVFGLLCLRAGKQTADSV